MAENLLKQAKAELARTSDGSDDDLSLTSTLQPVFDREYQVDCILAEREVKIEGHSNAVHQYLIKWTGYDIHSSSWELAAKFHTQDLQSTVNSWNGRKESELSGKLDAFDIEVWRQNVETIKRATQSRKRRRRAKRLRLAGLGERLKDNAHGDFCPVPGSDSDDSDDSVICFGKVRSDINQQNEAHQEPSHNAMELDQEMDSSEDEGGPMRSFKRKRVISPSLALPPFKKHLSESSIIQQSKLPESTASPSDAMKTHPQLIPSLEMLSIATDAPLFSMTPQTLGTSDNKTSPLPHPAAGTSGDQDLETRPINPSRIPAASKSRQPTVAGGSRNVSAPTPTTRHIDQLPLTPATTSVSLATTVVAPSRPLPRPNSGASAPSSAVDIFKNWGAPKTRRRSAARKSAPEYPRYYSSLSAYFRANKHSRRERTPDIADAVFDETAALPPRPQVVVHHPPPAIPSRSQESASQFRRRTMSMSAYNPDSESMPNAMPTTKIRSGEDELSDDDDLFGDRELFGEDPETETFKAPIVRPILRLTIPETSKRPDSPLFVEQEQVPDLEPDATLSESSAVDAVARFGHSVKPDVNKDLPPIPTEKPMTCWYWANEGGTCPDTTECPFAHRMLPDKCGPNNKLALSDKTCFFWAKGRCSPSKGPCRYAHHLTCYISFPHERHKTERLDKLFPGFVKRKREEYYHGLSKPAPPEKSPHTRLNKKGTRSSPRAKPQSTTRHAPTDIRLGCWFFWLGPEGCKLHSSDCNYLHDAAGPVHWVASRKPHLEPPFYIGPPDQNDSDDEARPRSRDEAIDSAKYHHRMSVLGDTIAEQIKAPLPQIPPKEQAVNVQFTFQSHEAEAESYSVRLLFHPPNNRSDFLGLAKTRLEFSKILCIGTLELYFGAFAHYQHLVTAEVSEGDCLPKDLENVANMLEVHNAVAITSIGDTLLLLCRAFQEPLLCNMPKPADDEQLTLLRLHCFSTSGNPIPALVNQASAQVPLTEWLDAGEIVKWPPDNNKTVSKNIFLMLLPTSNNLAEEITQHLQQVGFTVFRNSPGSWDYFCNIDNIKSGIVLFDRDFCMFDKIPYLKVLLNRRQAFNFFRLVREETPRGVRPSLERIFVKSHVFCLLDDCFIGSATEDTLTFLKYIVNRIDTGGAKLLARPDFAKWVLTLDAVDGNSKSGSDKAAVANKQFLRTFIDPKNRLGGEASGRIVSTPVASANEYRSLLNQGQAEATTYLAHGFSAWANMHAAEHRRFFLITSMPETSEMRRSFEEKYRHLQALQPREYLALKRL